MMAEGVVVKRFSCDDLPKRCFTSFAELRSENQLCDFTFSVGEVSISAHRVILAAAIPYYRNMFLKGIDEVPVIEPNTLACLIDYAYTHEVSIDTNNVKSLLDAARQLGMDDVKQACCDFLSDGVEPETVKSDEDLGNRFDSSKRLEDTNCDIRNNLSVLSEKGDSLRYTVTNLKDLADKDDRNVEQKGVLDDVLPLVKVSPEDGKDNLPELQSERRTRMKDPPHLSHVQNGNMFSKGIDEVPDIEPNTLACMIDHPFWHEVSTDTNNVKSLLDAARQLGMDDLKQACCDFSSDGVEPETAKSNEDLENRFDSSKRLEDTNCDIRNNLSVLSQKGDSLRYPVTNLKDLADKDDRNVEQEEVLDDVLPLVKVSPEDGKDDLPELQSKRRTRLEEPPHFENADLSPETRLVDYSHINQRKGKEEYASNEQIQRQSIYKLTLDKIHTVQRFNLSQKKWFTETSQIFFKHSGSAVPLQNEVYFFCFATTLQYDSRCNSFMSMSSMPTVRDMFGATALNKIIYICGGRLRNSVVVNAVECFYPPRDTWGTVESMPTPRMGLSAVTLDECIFAIGGKCERTVHRTVEKYDPMHDEWKSTSPMLDKRFAAGAATLNGNIYVCGGMSMNENAVSSCEMYYPDNDNWVNISPLNSRRCSFSLLSFQEKLHAIGGWTTEDHVLVFDIYNPENDEWTVGPSTDEEYLTSSAFVLPVIDA